MVQPEHSERLEAADAAEGADHADGAAAAPERTSEQLREALEEMQGRYTRAVADYQNLRRRSAEERREHARLTMKAAVLNYLPVFDDLNRALDAVQEHPEIADHQWVEGVRIVQRKFMGVLEASGVKRIEAKGCPFDPAVHEAVSYLPGPEGQVVDVVHDGYVLDDWVIRPASVVVGNGEEQAAATSA